MMKWLVAAVLTTAFAGTAIADIPVYSCGPGCHFASNGGCVVDGWETGARVWNECPAGARPQPPCGEGYRWRRLLKACTLRN
jgi:hypothetical protein